MNGMTMDIKSFLSMHAEAGRSALDSVKLAEEAGYEPTEIWSVLNKVEFKTYSRSMNRDDKPSNVSSAADTIQLESPAQPAVNLLDAVEEAAYLFTPIIQCALPYTRQVQKGGGVETPVTAIHKSSGALTVTIGMSQRPKEKHIRNDLSSRFMSSPVIPFGGLARLVMSHCITKAVKSKSRVIDIPDPATFLIGLNVKPVYGKAGSVTQLALLLDGFRSLYLTSTFNFRSDSMAGLQRYSYENMFFSSRGDFWFDEESQDGRSYLELSSHFIEAISEHSAPICPNALRTLYPIPMDMDLYALLSYRSATLKRKVMFTWEELRDSSGSNVQNLRAFKQDFLASLKRVSAVYTGFKLEVVKEGAVIGPGTPHIKRLMINGI